MTDQQTPIPPLGPGSPGTEGFWADIDRAYDTEYRHNARQSELNQKNMSFISQLNQSQIMGLMLLSEAEVGMQEVDEEEEQEPDPT